MERKMRDEVIVVVTDASERSVRLSDRIEAAADCTVRSVPASALVDGTDVLEEHRPDAVVLELDRTEAVGDVLQCVREWSERVPTIVAPQSGTEPLAVTALRQGATEYVPVDGDESVDRILASVRAVRDPPADRDRSYHRVLANELPDEAFVIGEDGTYLEARVRSESADLYTMSSAELTGTHLAEAFPEEDAKRLQACLEQAIDADEVQSIEYDAVTTDGTRRFEARVVPLEERVGGQRAVVWLARDITERAMRERELRSRQAELETLNRINAVGRQVIETLVEAPGREAIEAEVCEQLVDSELYCGSWIGERGPDGELSYRVGRGEAATYLACLREADLGGGYPAHRASIGDEVQTMNRILETDPLPDPLQAAACEDDVRAAIAVPIFHEDVTYGVLTVLSSRDDAFSDNEQAAFELLGETMGFTIMAVKNRQLLFADSVVELEFRIDGGDTLSFDLTRRHECACSLEWTGTTTRGRTYQYVTVSGLDGETVLAAAADHDSVEECRLIHDGADQCTIEMRLCKSGVRTLASHGATLRDVRVEDAVGTCRVEVPQDADVREIADALAGVYENTELVARREVDRPVRTASERRNRILDELTDRQLTTLRLAYYGGFFDWPRESTGEEIAEAMDVSAPTMHQHLRKGMKTVLGEFFEEGGGTTD